MNPIAIVALQNASVILKAYKVYLDRAAFLVTNQRSHNAVADVISAIEYIVKNGLLELSS
jgi:hypothetical protein